MKSLRKVLTINLLLFIFTFLVAIFFYPFFLFGKIPIPADTIVGMYHPFRDVVWNGYKTGVPFKNFLITDPVRQQYVWRNLATLELRRGKLPLWNPYAFSGTPLLANFQSALFYPVNFLFFILPFNLAWGISVVLQPFLAGIFLYLYLRFTKISKTASLIGSLSFAFCGFSIAWLEWNTVIHTALWLPLILLSIEKIILRKVKSPEKSRPDPIFFLWVLVFLFSLTFSFFAGHLQIFFYSFLTGFFYTVIKLAFLKKKRLNLIILFVTLYILFFIITFVQWFPTLQFILLSARNFDQGSWLKPGWFMPWQNLIQFIAPDFFGNPATGNYWGVWNYAEFTGFIGVIPLLFSLIALVWRKDKKTMFFGTVFFLSLIFATPTFLAVLPYKFKIPFISTSQPTRLLFLADFSLAVLASLGFDYFTKSKNLLVQIIKLLAAVGIIYGFLWFFVLFFSKYDLPVSPENMLIAKRNLILPSFMFLGGSFLLILMQISLHKNSSRHFRKILCYFLFFLIIFDLFRFGWKFTPFSKKEWIFPSTGLTETLKKDKSHYRIMVLDRRIMPPNFSSYYLFQDVSGYDPLYLKTYAEFVSAWERDKPDLSPSSFNRIITPQNTQNIFSDLLGVKYYLSFGQVKSEDLKLIEREGETFLYENTKSFPRAFIAEEVIKVRNSQEEIEKMFSLGEKLRHIGVTTEDISLKPSKTYPEERVKIVKYEPDYIEIAVNSKFERLLILTDQYYPSWKAYLDGKKTKIFKVDFAFRGIIIPAGEHKVEYKTSLL